MKLLQIAMPVAYDKWNGNTPLLVGFMTYEVDDNARETITAFDADLKEYTLSAKVAPSYPVVILSLNERLDPSTMRLKSVEYAESANRLIEANPALRKASSSNVPLHIYLEWFKTSDTYDPWPASDGEFSAGVMTDVKDGSGKYLSWIQHVRDGVKAGSWYQRHIGLFQYDPIRINKYCNLKFHEDDTWEFDVTMSLSIQAKGAVNKDVNQTLNGSVKVGNGDDIVGSNQFDVSGGPMNPLASQRANVLNAGTVQFAAWWGGLNNDGTIAALPYSSNGSNTGLSDRWPLPGTVSSPDFTYAIYLEQQAKVNFNTCHGYTSFPNFDTHLTI